MASSVWLLQEMKLQTLVAIMQYYYNGRVLITDYTSTYVMKAFNVTAVCYFKHRRGCTGEAG